MACVYFKLARSKVRYDGFRRGLSLGVAALQAVDNRTVEDMLAFENTISVIV